jgi:peptidoglycan hydrolase-like protein with peptidoglycan-binding domain
VTKKIFLGLLFFALSSIVNAKSNANQIREIQLMLSQSGYDLGYGDSKGIDGKLGQITKDAIKDYQAKKHLTPTGVIDNWLYDSLYEDTKIKPVTQPAGGEEIEEKISSLKKLITKIPKPEPVTPEILADSFYEGSTFSTGMISLIIAVLALLSSFAGYMVYGIVKKKLEDDFSQWGSQLKGSIYLHLSGAFYLYYKELFQRDNYQENPSFNSGVELALMFSEGALKSINDMKNMDYDLLMNAKAYKAYHLATRNLPEDIELSFGFVTDIDAYSNSILINRGDVDNWARIRETIAWIYIRSNILERVNEGREIVNEILRNRRVHQLVKNEIRNNYLRTDPTANSWIYQGSVN